MTTEDINKLGITAVIGEFTTRGFAADSGTNIRTAAAAINGSILQPGETFSLNGATGNRSAASGYIEAGIIEDGHPSRGVGGGVSQVATTLYNAGYFAGMTDVEHREHSFYISPLPGRPGGHRVQGALDVKFRNDNPDRGLHPDRLDAVVDHGPAVRHQALRRHVGHRPAHATPPHPTRW